MSPQAQEEIWKVLVFEGIDKTAGYEISNFGHVRRLKVETSEYIELNPSNFKGYKIYSFKSSDEYKHTRTKTIHKLVAENFLPKDNDLQRFVIHLDYNKANNCAANLRWVTRETMHQHHKLNPNYRYPRPRRVTNSKLTETEVIRIKMKLKRGKTALYKIAKEFGITHTQLNRIRSGENWGHVDIE
ncbi:MAG: hypothetical protein HC896_07610 [Bacteroidales bacterium]|nr:hypothetical protein [Bacteroidales bacterium]